MNARAAAKVAGRADASSAEGAGPEPWCDAPGGVRGGEQSREEKSLDSGPYPAGFAKKNRKVENSREPGQEPLGQPTTLIARARLCFPSFRTHMTRPRRDAMSDEVGVSARCVVAVSHATRHPVSPRFFFIISLRGFFMRKADGETPWPAAADPWPDTPPPFSTCRVFPCSARSVGDTPRVSKRKSRGTSLSVPASPKNGGGDEAEAPAGSAKKGPNALPLFDATDGAVGLSFGAAARSITQPPPAKRQKQQSAPASSVDDEAFARALQEEENARYELERTESRRRGEEWRRQHEEMMFAADDLDELLDEDDEDDLESQDMATAEEDGETEVVADGQLSADSAAAAHRAARREAAQRARARVGQVRPCGAFPNPGTYVV